MSTVSTATVREASRATNALEGKGIEVAAVEFDADEDTFSLILAGGNRVGTSGLGGGTIKEQGDVDTEGLGGGTIKDPDE